MARRVIDITRRQFLVGAAGVTVGLPVLPSLLTKSAYGADPTFTRAPRLYWITSEHGGAFESSMFPSASLLKDSQALYSDHTVKAGALAATTSGDNTVLSAILSAKSSVFTPSLVSKMNVLWGLDVPFYIAHNTGLHLGNYARNDGNGSEGVDVQAFPRPTIDQIMAWSPSFYPDLGSIRERAMIFGSRPVSWNYSDPSSQSGSIDNIRGSSSSLDEFKKIFVAPDAASMPSRPPIVDHVLESFNRLKNGNTRLSAADKQRLDDHIARIAELERKLTAGGSASCGDVTAPTDDANKHGGDNPDDAGKQISLYNEVAAVAFMCGTSRIGVVCHPDTAAFVSYGGDWHQEVAHQWQNDDAQQKLVPSYQRFFETAFLDMAARLDIEEANGVTYLDNSLVVWTQESGMETHGSVSIPVVTFGGAAGFLKTGQLIDYRRTGNKSSEYDPGAGSKQTLGLLYAQWLGTVLQSMGVPPSEYERWNGKGYGVPYVGAVSWGPPFQAHYGDTSSRYFADASKILPFLQA
ncbi:MAG TPA: DUF1552 domain-containing protein [Polyangiaceae bacterium]|jgi:hypothetical protein|nr:DUF1552 domain-containing protein [Polyangiaceae bacterium]